MKAASADAVTGNAVHYGFILKSTHPTMFDEVSSAMAATLSRDACHSIGAEAIAREGAMYSP
jgi:hypothetical protein